jgi:DNA-binding response OmpR family regulator
MACVNLCMTPDTGKPNTKKLQDKRILVVEDHPSIRKILADLLTSYCHLSTADSGRDALEKIEHNAPDLILLDLNLRDMNGLEIARLVRQNEKTSRTPILAMSGSCSPMDKIKCLEIGCNDFIHKPFSVRSLLVRLSGLIPIRSHSLNQDNSQLPHPLGN